MKHNYDVTTVKKIKSSIDHMWGAVGQPQMGCASGNEVLEGIIELLTAIEDNPDIDFENDIGAWERLTAKIRYEIKNAPTQRFNKTSSRYPWFASDVREIDDVFKLIKESGRPIKMDDIVDRCVRRGIRLNGSEDAYMKIYKHLEKLLNEGAIYEPTAGCFLATDNKESVGIPAKKNRKIQIGV